MTPIPERSSRLLRVALAGLAIACGNDTVPERATTRDSAGIAIVANPDPATAPEWSVGQPVFSLGALDAGDAYELYQPLHALRLDDGGIVVANQGTNELRFFDSRGTHVRTVGRKGGGPGEYEGMWGLFRLPGDSLGVWDWTAKRLTIYDDTGALGRLVTPALDLGFAPRIIGTLEDGTFYLLKGLNPGAVFASGGGVREDSLALHRLDLSGAVLDSVGPFPGPQRYVHMGEGSFWIRDIIFGRQEHLATGSETLLVGDDRGGEIRAHDPDGRLIRIARLAGALRPATTQLADAYRERYLADVEPDRLPEERRRIEALPVAEELPAFSDVFVDRLDRAWVRTFDTEYESPDRWLIQDPDGRLVGRVTLPPGVRPLDAGRDYLLVHHRDDLDIEHVTLYPLLTPTTP